MLGDTAPPTTPKWDWYDEETLVKKFAVRGDGAMMGELAHCAAAVTALGTAKPGVVTPDDAKCYLMLGTADMVGQSDGVRSCVFFFFCFCFCFKQ